MSYELKGKLIADLGINQVSDKFKKREFVVEVPGQYPEVIKCELKQDKVTLLDGVQIGSDVTVHFNLTGRKWTSQEGKTSYFVTVDAWKIETSQATAPAPAFVQPELPVSDELPQF
jgi:single-strand DNA-binding protein